MVDLKNRHKLLLGSIIVKTMSENLPLLIFRCGCVVLKLFLTGSNFIFFELFIISQPK